MMRVFSLVVLCLVGCQELPDKKLGVCGNGVIDQYEDCDSRNGGCDDQCRLHCPGGLDRECADAGSAYRCGADFICHAPSGVFRRQFVTSFFYKVGQGSIADIDGDKIGDVVGFSDVNIDVRFGDLGTDLSTRATAIVPFANTNSALRRLPGDPFVGTPATSDILLPTADGIAGFTARNKTLVSYPFSNGPGARGDCATNNGTAVPRESFSIDKHHIAFVGRYNDDAKKGLLTLAVMDPDKPNKCVHVDLCTVTAPASVFDKTIYVDHYEVIGSVPNEVISSMIAVASPADKMAPTAAGCVVRFSDINGAFSLSTTQGLSVATGPLAFARGTLGAVCPALYTAHPTATDDVGTDYYPETGTPCFIQSTPARGFFKAKQWPAGRIPTVAPPSGQPDLLAIITWSGISGSTTLYSLVNGVPGSMPVFQSQRPMYPLRYADLDGNGTIEGIGIVGTKVTSQPDIEVLYRTPVGTSLGFVTYRIPTQATPTYLEVGDFDGNGLPDIAYTEKLADHERLMVSYSTRDRPLDPVEIATFTNVFALSRIDIPDSIEPMGTLLDDLMVVDLIPSDPSDPTKFMPLLAILHGNPQRSMLSYYDPRNGVRIPPASEFAATVAGNFVTTTSVPGLMAFENVHGTPDSVTIWTASGSPLTRGFVDSGRAPISTTAISVTDCTEATTLCLSGANLVPWTLPDGRDVVLAADAPAFDPMAPPRDRFVVTIDPMNTADPIHANPDATLPTRSPAVSVWSGDVDGSGTRRLVIALPALSIFGAGTSEVRICDVDAQGHVTGCSTLPEMVGDLNGYTCSAAETGRIAAGSRYDGGKLGTQGLLALCRGGADAGIFHVYPGKDGTLVATPLIPNVGTYEFLSVGDLNGDLADDVAGIGFDPMSGSPIVSVHTQCEAHDKQCIEDNTDPLTQASAP